MSKFVILPYFSIYIQLFFVLTLTGNNVKESPDISMIFMLFLFPSNRRSLKDALQIIPLKKNEINIASETRNTRGKLLAKTKPIKVEVHGKSFFQVKFLLKTAV